MSNKPIVGVSACVVGQPVRYDKGHKQSYFVTDKLNQLVTLKPICPEVGMGLSVPRPTIRLRDVDETVRLMDDVNHIDYTDRIARFSADALPNMANYSGFIVCKKSPSCGMERVKVYQEDGKGSRNDGRGLFTTALMERYPLLPVEEDGRLNDVNLRENFVLRVLIYQQAQRLLAEPSQKALLAFHQQHKLLILAHNQPLYRELGPLAAQSFDGTIEEKCLAYITILMRALAKPASRRGHTNALQHIQGYFKRDLDSSEKQHLTQTIIDYRNGKLPLLAPVTVLKHIMTKYPKSYIAAQSYLNPTPTELGLRVQL